MSVLVRNLLAAIGGAGILILVLGLATTPPAVSPPEQLSYRAPEDPAPTPETVLVSEINGAAEETRDSPTEKEETAPPPSDIEREQTQPEQSPLPPRNTPPPIQGLPTETLNAISRESLVNILCESNQSYLKSISGSGVIISESGIILTNAHIAQQLLLEEYTNLPIECVIRYGSPAKPHWKARLLYISPQWVSVNAKSFLDSNPRGTGENDFALLLIDEPLYPSVQTLPYSFLTPHTKADPAPPGSTVLLAAYPAEFIGGSAARQALSITTAVTTIKDVYTFSENIVDLLSLGSSVLAQSGSSGGAVVNDQGKLVGLIVTTSEGTNTGTRDLRAITVEHIDRSLSEDTGIHLSDFANSPSDTLFRAQKTVHLKLAEDLVTYIKSRTR